MKKIIISDDRKLNISNVVIGYLQENKRSAKVWAESVSAKVIRIAKDKLQLTVEQSPIVQWIHQQKKKKKKEQLVEEQKVSKHHEYHL